MRTIREIFADNLRAIRGPRTQEEFSAAIEIPLSTYQKMEAGNVPQKENLTALATRLNVSEGRLFFDSEAVPAPTPKTALEILSEALESQDARIRELEATIASFKENDSIEAKIRGYLPLDISQNELSAIKVMCDGFKTARRIAGVHQISITKKNRA